MFSAAIKTLLSSFHSDSRNSQHQEEGEDKGKTQPIDYSKRGALFTPAVRSQKHLRSRFVSSNLKDKKEASTDPLKANSDIFMARPHEVDKCAWYVHTVDPATFCFPTPESINLPTVFGRRALEYAGHWVEHYYAPFVEECRKRDQLDLIRMLYHWYIAQFTIDYLNDVFPLTSGQYLASSALIDLPRHGIFDKNVDLVDHEFTNEESASPRPKPTAHTKYKLPNPIKAIKRRKAKAILMASREQMVLHENYLESLVAEYQLLYIRKALFGFYQTTVRQCDALSQTALFNSMSLDEYDAFRTLNAGGEMGFLRQTFLFTLLDGEEVAEDVDPQLADLGHVVGRNVALVNDLYGLEKDRLTGDPNIILKHHSVLTSSGSENAGSSTVDVPLMCSTSGSTDDSLLNDSIAWALEEIKGTVRYIQEFYRTNPDHLVTRYDIAMGCVSGNHGCHATCKRFELPVGVQMPTTLQYGTESMMVMDEDRDDTSATGTTL